MHEASGHIASTVRKEKVMNAGAVGFLLFVRGPSLQDGGTHIWHGSLNLYELSLENVSYTRPEVCVPSDP